jgi:hypothetical protein
MPRGCDGQAVENLKLMLEPDRMTGWDRVERAGTRYDAARVAVINALDVDLDG